MSPKMKMNGHVLKTRIVVYLAMKFSGNTLYAQGYIITYTHLNCLLKVMNQLHLDQSINLFHSTAK